MKLLFYAAWLAVLAAYILMPAAAIGSETAETAPQTAAEKTPSVFEGYFGESIWTLIWFLLLLAVLWRFAWRPLLAGLQSRQQYIERQIAEAEKMRQEAQKVLAEYQSRLADAERQGRQIVSAKIKEAEKEVQQVQLKGQQELEELRQRLMADLARQQQEIQDQFWQQAGEIIRHLGKEVFGKALDDADQQRLIDQAIAQLRQVAQPSENASQGKVNA